MKKNTILTILDFNGIPDKYEKKLYDAMEYLGNKERLVICLYFMSELSVKSMTHYNIERNLRRIFPPSKKGKLPDDYKDFQASVQRSYFDRETQKIKEKEINLEDRLWKNLGDGLWKNTEKGNCLAVATLKKEGYDIHKRRGHIHLTPEEWCKSFGNPPVDNIEQLNFYASKIRKGQQKFRKRLMYIYQNRCVVTGWGPDDVLEAAHIYPFSESGINQITNGLILRADIHCLFDSYLLNIHPETFEIVLDSSLEETGYWEFNKRKISKSIDEQYPAKKFLHLRWDIAHSISVETNQY